MVIAETQTKPTAADNVYIPFGAARELWRTRDEQVLFEGPAGTGKTRGLCEYAFALALEYDGCRILFIRQTRESMTQSVLVTWEDKVVPTGHPCLLGPERPNRSSYKFSNGSEIVVAGMKSHGKDASAKIMSTEFDLICVFEATEVSINDFEKLTTRLRNNVIPWQQIVADCNPGPSTHWLNRRGNDGKMTRLLSRHEDNPVIYRNGDWTITGRKYIATLDALSGPRRERLRFGRWATAEGVVYEGWDPAIHLIEPFPIPEDWEKWRCIDFGFKNPFVCQWWAMDGDGRLYLYREIYRTKRIVARHAKQITALTGNENILATVADHDAEDRATLDEANIGTMPAKKQVRPGIDAMTERLRVQDDGRARLYIFKDCLVEPDEELRASHKPICTAEEFDSYVWTKTADNKPVKEVPVKVDDHGMDTTRYIVMQFDSGTPLDAHALGAIDDEPDDDQLYSEYEIDGWSGGGHEWGGV